MNISKIDGPPKSVANLLCTTLATPRLIQQQHNWDEIIFQRALSIDYHHKIKTLYKDVNQLLIYLLQ